MDRSITEQCPEFTGSEETARLTRLSGRILGSHELAKKHLDDPEVVLSTAARVHVDSCRECRDGLAAGAVAAAGRKAPARGAVTVKRA